jgi:hypothetical protein
LFEDADDNGKVEVKEALGNFKKLDSDEDKSLSEMEWSKSSGVAMK